MRCDGTGPLQFHSRLGVARICAEAIGSTTNSRHERPGFGAFVLSLLAPGSDKVT